MKKKRHWLINTPIVLFKYFIWKPLQWLFPRLALILLCLLIGFLVGVGFMMEDWPRCDYPQHFSPPPENPSNPFYYKKKEL